MRTFAWIGFLILAALQQPTQTMSGMIEGNVIGTDSSPISEVSVGIQASSGSSNLTTTTDARGRFVFRNVPPGRYDLQATREGYYLNVSRAVGYYASIFLTANQTFQVAPITFVRSGTITGQIKEADGRPATNLHLDFLRLV